MRGRRFALLIHDAAKDTLLIDEVAVLSVTAASLTGTYAPPTAESAPTLIEYEPLRLQPKTPDVCRRMCPRSSRLR